MKKIITIISVIIIAGIGYWVYQSTLTLEEETKEEETKDEVSVLLEDFEQETGIDFSEAQPVDFKWIVKVDPKVEEEAVSGKGFEAERISSEQYDSIELFLKDNGFEVDIYNIAAGTISELTGYIKGKTVCTVAGGLTGYKEAEGQWIPTDTDNWDITVKCGNVEKTKMEYATENWQSYTNEKYGYSLEYPQPCLYGPLPGYCKQSPPEERPRECLCYFNAEDPNSVSLATYTGTKSDLTGAEFVVFHSIYVDRYSPPAGTDLVDWVKENFPHYDDIPDEINMEIDGIPALKVYTPFSGMAWSQEDIYFIKNDKLLKIQMLNVDDEGNRALYDKILFTFSMEELSQCAKDGEQFSTANNEYPDHCCEGLKEWIPIPDTRFSIADVCYEVGSPSESNIGLCIKCGDEVCENHLNYDENPCNCPEDCAGKNKSHFQNIEEFCRSNDWKMSLFKACEETIKDFSICKLCAP